MASTNFLPDREPELVVWSRNFKTKIILSAAIYGLTPLQATTYGGLHDDFETKFNLCNSGATNSHQATVDKNDSKDLLIANARLLAGIVQKFPGTTDGMRADLGLTIRATPAPRPVPANAPNVDVLSVKGRTVRIRLHDSTTVGRRGKPAGCDGASVYSFVGAEPPAPMADGWKFEGNITRTNMDVAFATTVAPGAQVWITACWFNEKKEAGPWADPVSTNIAGTIAAA